MDRVMIFGGSGSGKSTLARALARWQGQRPVLVLQRRAEVDAFLAEVAALGLARAAHRLAGPGLQPG